MRLIYTAFITSALVAQQMPPLLSPQEGVPKFTSNTQLVLEMVTVKRKDGQTVKGLTAKDFTIKENGELQRISLCEFQDLDGPEPPSAASLRGTRMAASPFQIAIDRYRSRRLLVLYFDRSATPQLDQSRAFDAAITFVTRQMNSADLLAILSFSHGLVRVHQDFTGNRSLLCKTIANLKATLAGAGMDLGLEGGSSSDIGSAFGQDSGEFHLFNTDSQLSALQTTATMLGKLSERKAVIYFASGLNPIGVSNHAQLRATINAAVRANVSFFTVDARGLVAEAPLGSAAQSSFGGTAMYDGSAALARSTSMDRSQDTLWSLAVDTGGKALLDNNNLAAGITLAQKAISSYYLIGYYTTNDAHDGRYRKVQISLNTGAPATVSYREGYFARKDFNKFNAAEKERQLEDALMLVDPITDLTIAMEVNYFQLNRAEYFVPVAIKIPGSELVRARKEGAERTVIDFIGEIKDESGTTVTNVRDKITLKLTDSTATELARRHIKYDTGFTLIPGSYTIKFLARDAETGRIGTFISPFIIPNLAKDLIGVPVSSSVLGTQYIDMKAPAYTVAKSGAQLTNPLVQNGRKLIPSVTRVFSCSKPVYIYLEAYQRGASANQALIAIVGFYRGSAKIRETSPLLIAGSANPKVTAVPIRLTVNLNGLEPGMYMCQINVLDPNAQKATFRQVPITVVP